MAELTVAKLAETVGTPVEKLLEQLQAAGIAVKGESSEITEQQRQDLLAYLRKSHGEDTGGPQRITLQRKSLSTLKTTTTSGTTKQVQVEVRKKRTFVKRTPEELAALEAGGAACKTEVEEETKPVELEDRRRHEEESRRQAELEARKRAEEDAARRAEEDLKRRAAEESAKRPGDSPRPSAPSEARPAARPGV